MAGLSWILFPLLLSVFLLFVWCLTLGIIAAVSGWSRLARRFSDERPFSGKTNRFVSARIGMANYNGVLVVGADASGLYLRTARIFRPFHRPLRIPWAEVRADRGGGEDFDPVRLTFPAVPRLRMTLVPSHIGAHLRPYLAASAGETTSGLLC